jgi:plastocyanin
VARVRTPRLSFGVRRAVPWLVAALFVATVGLPSAAAIAHAPTPAGIGFAHPLSGNSSVTVNLTDAPAFVPSSLSATPNSTFSVELVNQGTYNHTFTLSNVPDLVLSPSLSPAELDSFFAKNGSLANVSVAPGATAFANLTFNASVSGDSFEFVSVVPYQFQSGMRGFVNLSVSGPGVELMENTTDAYRFVPAELAANGTHYPLVIDVMVTNQGSLSHTFTVSPLSNYTLSPANFSDTFTTNAPLVSQSIASGAGTTAWANFTVKAPGVYQYICTVPGHFANGMDGFLYVGVPPTPPPAPPSTAIVEAWILVGSAGLLAVGILVAAIASYSGRFPSKPGNQGEGGYH